MTIDEAITHAREVAKKNREICILKTRENAPIIFKCAEEHEQLAEWLEELKEYQEISKKNPFLVDMIKHDKIVRNKAIDDFSNTLKENYDYLPQILSQKAFDGYIDEYAEQLKAGGENE